MAGVGFELRRLTARGDLLGRLQAYVHASASVAGGWLMTVVALAIIAFFGPAFADYDEVDTFRLIITWNFAFSLVLTGPLTMVLTRYLSDQIFARSVQGVPGMVIGGLAVALGMSALVAVPLYGWYFDLSDGARVAACVGLALVSAIWVLGIFLSTLKEYAAVTQAFGGGMVLGVIAAWWLGPGAGASGLLAGFNLGLACIVFLLVGRVFAEFPFDVQRPFAFVPYFRRHWPLAASGGLYYLGVWVDKWIMWTSPGRIVLPSRLVSYPDYDSALFLATLTIVPAMALFVVHVETTFFERYHRFYREIGEHATLHRIRENQAALLQAIQMGARRIVVPQIVLAVTVVVLAPWLFTTLDIPYGQLAIFRIATVGAVFHLFFLLLTIVLSYFDRNRAVLAVYALFFTVNLLGTLVTARLGFAFYGYGYFAACVVAFVAASLATFRSVDTLAFDTFVTRNTSVR